MKTHKYTLYLLLITVFHCVQQTKTKNINQDSHGLDYSSELNNHKKNYNTTTYNLVHQPLSTLKPFLQKASLPEAAYNKNTYRSAKNDEQNQYVGLSLIRKENSNNLLNANNTYKLTTLLNSNIAPEDITLISRFNIEEQRCFYKNEVYYNGKCENLKDQDACGVGKVLVLDIKLALLPEPKIVPKCVQNNCSRNGVYWPATKQCYALNNESSKTLCLSGNEFGRDYFSGHGICRCTDKTTVYGEFHNGTCYELFTQGPCTEDYIFVEENQVTKCIKNPCKNLSLILWEDGDRKCYELNSQGPCKEREFFKVSTKTRKPSCVLVSNGATIVDVPEFCDDKIPGDCQNEIIIKQGSEYIKRILLLAKKKLNGANNNN